MRQAFRHSDASVQQGNVERTRLSPSIALCLLAVLLTGTGQAVRADTTTVYQCTQSDGTVVFSGKPCGPDAKQLTIDAPSAGTGSEAAMEGIREMAREYDKQQRLEREAAAKARATPPPVIEILPQAQTPSVQSYTYSPYYSPYRHYNGWSIHGSPKGWHFDIDGGIRPPRHDRHRYHPSGPGPVVPKPPTPTAPSTPAASGRMAAPPPLLPPR